MSVFTIKAWPTPANFLWQAVALQGLIYWRAKIVACPSVLQLFNDEIYLVHISVQVSSIKVAIYEIYGMKWGG